MHFLFRIVWKKQGDALSPLLFNSALLYAIRKVQVNKEELELKGTHQILVYADYVHLLDNKTMLQRKNHTLYYRE
jgi:hypothetical protein